MRWLSSSTLPNSPSTVRTINAGAGMMAGRPSTCPRVFASSRFLTGLGAQKFSGPLTCGCSHTNRIAAIRSVRCIQGNHWLPLPMGPPTKDLKAGIILARAPPPFPRITPNRISATRIPLAVAFRASASQSTETDAKKSLPGFSSSFKRSSPRLP